MKYCGPDIVLPLSEFGRVVPLENVPLSEAQIVLCSETGAKEFLKRAQAVVLLSGTGELISSCSKLVIFGSHYLSGSDRERVHAKGAKLFPLNVVIEEGITGVCDALMEQARSLGTFVVCITDSLFESDSFAGGLSVREVLYVIQRLKLLKEFAGACVVMPQSVRAAKLIAELAAPQGF